MSESLSIRSLTRCGDAEILYVDIGGREAQDVIKPALAVCTFASGTVAVVPASTKCLGADSSASEAQFGIIVESRALAHVAATAGVAVPRLDGRFEDGVPDPVIRALLEALQQELAVGGLATAMYIDTLVAQVVVRIMRAFTSGGALPAAPAVPLGPQPPANARLARALRYIEHHLGAPIAVEDIARAADLSPYHFSRSFKQWTGESPHRYLLRQRLVRAQQLVMESAMPLAQIATAVGFYDQSHLGHHYKRQFGATPHEARARKILRTR